MPVPLHIYSEIPTMRSIAPMNGPIYGGFAIDIDGNGFINTGAVTVRFELLQGDVSGESEQQGRCATPRAAAAAAVANQSRLDAADSAATDTPGTVEPVIVDARAEFASPEHLLCMAPVFPQEGVYMVSVSLNGVEFSKISASSWFLVWQNWQRRKLLLASHKLFTHPMGGGREGVADSARGAADPSSLAPLLVDDEIHILRRKGSFMLPHSSADAEEGDPRAFGGVRLPLIHKQPDRSSVMNTVMKYYEEIDDERVELTDPKLLHWHPASAADEKCVVVLRHCCVRTTCACAPVLTHPPTNADRATL